ncbi:unnamed protein product [Mytilus coruscus]|uniref:Reverse transcriptase zinc-binding domain-containing protein n=1 Tax=Mytilus coruscus TaxID=42192 RepID=A0A6J8A5K9_MYTCO|nr:unnamed protein product [Mytilus coruscus]
MIELDYKIMHNCVFTNVKLKKIGRSDSDLCDVCHKENEDIMHVFINCDELEDFHDYLSALVCKIFENCDSDKINLVQSEMLLLNGLRWKMKGVNDLFLNFVLSVARFCIFRRRHLLKNGHKNVHLTKLFQYTLKHYVTYFYVYLCKQNNKSNVFEKNFLKDNPIVQETDDVLVFDL